MDERLRLTEKQQKDLEKLQSALRKLEKDNVGLIISKGGWIGAVNKKDVEKMTYWDDRNIDPSSEEATDDIPGVILSGLTLDEDESWFRVKFKDE